jgi:hypothetical protein
LKSTFTHRKLANLTETCNTSQQEQMKLPAPNLLTVISITQKEKPAYPAGRSS